MEGLDFNIAQEYRRLEKKIVQTSDVLEQIVRGQGGSIKLQYVRKTLFLCLVRQTNSNGECCSLRWAKVEFKDDSRTWFNGWMPGRVPGSVTRKMSPEGRAKFRALDKMAVKACDLRKDLTTKKKRIIGTFQSVRQTTGPKLKNLIEDIQAMQAVQAEPEVEAKPDVETAAADEAFSADQEVEHEITREAKQNIEPAEEEMSVPDTRTEEGSSIEADIEPGVNSGNDSGIKADDEADGLDIPEEPDVLEEEDISLADDDDWEFSLADDDDGEICLADDDD